jgi:hypothetical protein
VVARAFKIFGMLWLIGWLLTWVWDIKTEAEHPEYYSIVTPTGESRFHAQQFVAQMMEHGMGLFLSWPLAAGLQVGLNMGWVCRSSEIGRC